MTDIVINHNISFFDAALSIVEQGQRYAFASVNQAIITTYWHLGKHIVEEEQKGSRRAAYGTELIKTLADVLTARYGNSYNWRNLHYFRLFYLSFSDIEILNACVQNLTWTHIRCLEQESSKKLTTSYKS